MEDSDYKAPKRISIKSKVTFLVMGGCFVALLVTAVALVVLDFNSVRRDMVRDLDTLAQIIAQNSHAAVYFMNEDDAQDDLKVLRHQKNIMMACIYDKDYRPFAGYNRPDVEPYWSHPLPTMTDYEFRDNGLHLVRDIKIGNEKIGTVYLQSDLTEIFSTLKRYSRYLAAICITAFVLVFMLTAQLQKVISAPILNLARTAKLVSQDSDYSIRAVKHTNDEIGFLTESFNAMLSQIQERDRELERRAEALEKELKGRKRIEAKLRQSELRFRDLFDNAPDMYIILDPEGRIVEFNQRGLARLKYSSDEVVGKPMTAIMSPEDAQNAQKVLRKILMGRLPKNMEARLVDKTGEVRWVIKEFSLLKDKDEIKSIRVICRDITERKRLQEELERAHRLETAGRIAGQIAHDFNNLLGPLAAYPQLMREDLPSDHPVIEMVNEMELAARKIADINQQLLSLGRRGHYAMEPLDLNELLERVLISIGIESNSILRVRKRLAKNLFLIRGGDAQLTRALSNLFYNAVEAMHGKGILRINTDNIYLDKPLHGYKTVTQGEYVRLEVKDTGSGIPPEILNKIFDPFFTTKTMDRMRGSGLGLSVVHGVIADHHGYVTVQSEVGKGTTFTIHFPVARDVQVETAEIAEKLNGGDERILIVDDDPIQRKVTSFLLDRLGYVTDTAASGEQAVELVETDKPDLLIIDMVMDGIDGAETYRRILKKNPAQKAIILSGYAMSKRVKHAISLGAGKFVSKPISLTSLAKAVRSELDQEGTSTASSKKAIRLAI